MRVVFTTFCATSLIWSCALLYCFCTGKIERTTPDFATAIERAQPVNIARRG